MIKRFLRKFLSWEPEVLEAKALKDITPFENEIIETVLPFTMTSKERILSLIRSVQYVIKHNIPGDFIECGVWKGGSAMTMAIVLNHLNIKDRNLLLFDTFSGMSSPTDLDRDRNGNMAEELLIKVENKQSHILAKAELKEVQNNLKSTGFPYKNIQFIEGKVEDTLPSFHFSEIALLRLDTDWYESTKIELELMFPKLSNQGVLIIDDYGHWEGAKKAVDEYFENLKQPYFLHRIDYTGRMLIKNDLH